MKKSLTLLLALVMIMTLLPVQRIYATSGTGSVSGMELKSELFVRESYVSEVTTGPVLAEGEHELWIDRIGNLPDFAKEFYGWLEDNASPTGALADPSLGETVEGVQVHLVEAVSGSVPFSYKSGDSITDKAYEAAVADVGNLPYVIADYIFATYAAFDRDHPEVFWLTGSSSCGSSIVYNYSGGGGSAVAEYTLYMYFYLQADSFDLRAPDYQNVSAIAAAAEQQEADIQRILADYPYEGSVREQIVYFNEVLTRTNAYNSAVIDGDFEAASPAAWECISALSGSVGTDGPVCEGYARALNVLCDRVGIPCVLAEGIGNNTPHMWNYVKMDDQWYGVDVTFSDPVNLNQPEAAESGTENNNWIGLGATSDTVLGMPFSETHVLENVSYKGGLDYSNGPALAENGYEAAANYMDIAPYRSAQGYTAPELSGFVFAGWYADAELTQPLSMNQTAGWAYAKFVDANVLTLKFQTTYGTTADSSSTDLRLLTSVADLQLNSVGFVVNVSTATQNLNSRTVYEKIKAGDTIISEPNRIFGADSAYFVTYTLLDVPQTMFDTTFDVTPCWKTMDGTTVTGTPRTFCISETY